MIINHNIAALNTHRQLSFNNTGTSKSLEKLSSGFRINRAGDDAAGLAISEKMRAQIRGLDMAAKNSQDGISMIQTAEGALNETHSILQRMRELATQSANGTNTDTDRSEIQKEINQLSEELTRISDTTEFNTQKLLDGTLTSRFHIGANEGQNIGISVKNMSAEALNVISDTIAMGSSGKGVQGVDADLGFQITGAVLTATKGGAVGAALAANSAGIGDGFARNITGISAADGVNGTPGAGTVPTLSSGGVANQISISASDDINWEAITTTGSTITIGKDGDNLTVDIVVTDDTGAITINDAFAETDAHGNYVYNAHGVSFTISADDFAAMENDTTVVIDLEAAVGTGTVDVLAANGGVIGTKNSWTSNVVAAPGDVKAAFTGSKIDVDFDALPAGVDSVQVERSGTAITVTLSSGGTAVSTDVYNSAAWENSVLNYDNHGVSFELNVNDATTFNFEHDIETYDTKVSLTAADPLKFNITDADGVERAISVDFGGTGDYSLEEIADAINDAAYAVAGANWDGQDVAVVTGNSLELVSSFAGTDSKVQITDAGGASSLFSTGGPGLAKGADASIDFTLSDANGIAIDTVTNVNGSSKSVTFEDSSGNKATFNLAGYSNLDNVDVAKEFAASNFTREVTGIDVSSAEAADKAITVINDAIEYVSSERSMLGAIQNRLEHTINNLGASAENLTAAESRIRDVDMAKEMMAFTKNNILTQAAQAMLAQANQQPQGVLQLLR